MALQTDKPSGRTAWPRILLEGTELSGKSWSVAALSASPKVGRTVVLVLGEDTSMWHEYGRIPGARFEIAKHDGTWASIIDVARDVRDEAVAAVAAGQPPFVFAVDTMTAVWDGLKDWASHRARNSRAGRAALAADPDAKVDVAPNYWNDANERHGALTGILLTIPGIVVMIARGGEVTLFENGQPAKGNKTTWSVQVQKGLPYAATAHMRLSNGSRPLLVGRKGVVNPIRPGIDPALPLPGDWSLESVIFGTLGLDASTASVGGYTEMRQDMSPEEIADEAMRKKTSAARVKELYRIAVNARYHGVKIPNEHLDEEPLLDLLIRFGRDKAASELAAAPAASAGSDSPAEVHPGPHDADQAEVADEARAAKEQTQTQQAAEPETEADFVRDFYTRLEGTSDLDGIEERRGEVSKALAGKTIAPGTASELYGDIQKKKRTLGRAA